MLEISPEKIAHGIIRAREYDSGVNAWAHSGQRRGHGTETELAEFIAALNEDEQASLVAVMSPAHAEPSPSASASPSVPPSPPASSARDWSTS